MPETTRDESGRITATKLSSKEASEMGKTRWVKAGKDVEEKIRSLLESRGLDYEACDQGLMALARLAVGGKTSAVSALRYLDLVTGYYNPSVPEGIRVGANEICPVCKRGPNTLDKLPIAVIEKLVSYAQNAADGDTQGSNTAEFIHHDL
jgi:hypothetical protein